MSKRQQEWLFALALGTGMLWLITKQTPRGGLMAGFAGAGQNYYAPGALEQATPAAPTSGVWEAH